jgi:hypothetical protein
VVKRGGRKEMQLPEGSSQPRRNDSTLVKALARAFRWKRMQESGEFTAPRPALGPSRITLENNGKIRPQPDREIDFARANDGGDGPETQPSPP